MLWKIVIVAIATLTFLNHPIPMPGAFADCADVSGHIGDQRSCGSYWGCDLRHGFEGWILHCR